MKYKKRRETDTSQTLLKSLQSRNKHISSGRWQSVPVWTTVGRTQQWGSCNLFATNVTSTLKKQVSADNLFLLRQTSKFIEVISWPDFYRGRVLSFVTRTRFLNISHEDVMITEMYASYKLESYHRERIKLMKCRWCNVICLRSMNPLEMANESDSALLMVRCTSNSAAMEPRIPHNGSISSSWSNHLWPATSSPPSRGTQKKNRHLRRGPWNLLLVIPSFCTSRIHFFISVLCSTGFHWRCALQCLYATSLLFWGFAFCSHFLRASGISRLTSFHSGQL